MSHATHATGHNPNLTPSQQTAGVPQYQHRGSNSFSGVSGKHVLTSAGAQDAITNKVLSEKGDGQGRRAGGPHGHARTQQSADLQAQIQGKLYPPPMALSQVTNDYLSIAQSVDNKGNAVGRAGGGSGARGVDVKRRTTGSLFQMPNAQTVNSLAQSQLNSTNPPAKQPTALSPQGQSLGAPGKVNRRIQNIVSPIQDSTPAPVTRKVSNNLILAPSRDSPQAPGTHAERRREPDVPSMTYPSALEHNAMHQSMGNEERPSYPPLQSEQQSMIENSLFYESMIPRVNPTSNGSGSRGNTGHNDHAPSATVSHQANLGSRINNPEVTPREGTECAIGSGLTGGMNTAQGVDALRIGQESKEGSAQCRVDTDLSGRAYLAASQDDGESTLDKLRHNGRHGRRAEEARTQHGPDGPTPLRQMNNPLPARVIHSNQDHSNLPARLMQSQE